ncbi:hypothetical protein Syun_029836 [Stephania yunnanensis]|uniref:Uncharacterized protein n=1 Tax=Stephania yunnanensis TaxID=152371 RepID=A0AAP0E9N8_9MAGN
MGVWSAARHVASSDWRRPLLMTSQVVQSASCGSLEAVVNSHHLCEFLGDGAYAHLEKIEEKLGEENVGHAAPHKPSPSSALSVLPCRRLLCPLPSSVLSLAIVCSVLASPIDDRRLHLVPDVDDHGLFVLKGGAFVDYFVKGFRICLRECERMGIALPGLTLAHQFYLSVKAHGEGRLGTQALFLALERLNGIRIELDEALAMHLQDLDNQLENDYLDDDIGREAAMGGGVGAASEVSSCAYGGNRLSQVSWRAVITPTSKAHITSL